VIDFRYHLISIIAVLLALAIGILAGSGFLGGPLLADLRHRLDNIAQANTGLQNDVDTLRKISQQDQNFAQATEPWLVGKALAGVSVVVLEPQGTDSAASDGIVTAIVAAGGTVGATLSFTDKFSLADPTAIDQLALSLHSTSGSARKLRDQSAVRLGRRAAAAARSVPSRGSGAPQTFDKLLGPLEKDGFVNADRASDGSTVGPGAVFVVVAGAADPPPFAATDFCLILSRALATHSGTVLAAEPSISTWNFVSSVRGDTRTERTVATVDDAETIPGGIAAALGLRDAMRGQIGHYGFAPGADAVIPQPAVSP
jgi:Copper transport outer membrane protein, MctB